MEKTLENKDIKLNLEILPEKVRKLELQLLKKTSEANEKQLLIDSMKVAFLSIVTDEKENDKPKFSNQQKRDIETDKRLQKDRTFIQVSEEIKRLKKEISEDSIELSFIKRTFSAMTAICRLGE